MDFETKAGSPQRHVIAASDGGNTFSKQNFRYVFHMTSSPAVCRQEAVSDTRTIRKKAVRIQQTDLFTYLFISLYIGVPQIIHP